MSPPLPRGAPPSALQDQKDALVDLQGVSGHVPPQAVTLSISEESLEFIKTKCETKGLSKWMAAARSLPGLYWLLGSYDNMPIYRQEANDDPEAPNSKQLYIFCWNGKEPGWYIATTFWTTNAEMNSLPDGNIIAWSKIPDNGDLAPPGCWHVPLWSKKAYW